MSFALYSWLTWCSVAGFIGWHHGMLISDILTSRRFRKLIFSKWLWRTLRDERPQPQVILVQIGED